MADFEKYAYEERYRYYEFKRTDDKDGLAPGESIISAVVTCIDSSGVDCTASMIDEGGVVDDTRVVYLLKAGTAGMTYKIIVKAVTSEGQRIEGVAVISVRQG